MQEKLDCEQCGKKFAKESSLRQHERDKHKIEQCRECGRKFERKKALKNHIWFVHKKKRRKKVRKQAISNDLRLYIDRMEEKAREKKKEIQKKKLAENMTQIFELQYLDMTKDQETEEERMIRLREERELGK